jgi:hypothetical protein
MIFLEISHSTTAISIIVTDTVFQKFLELFQKTMMIYSLWTDSLM